NDYTLQFAQASSKNLINWEPQSYPYVNGSKNVLRPVINYNKTTDAYSIIYTDTNEKYFQTNTANFKTYSTATEVPASYYNNISTSVLLNGVATKGQLHRVAWPVVNALLKAYQLQQYKSRLSTEVTKDDAQRFAGLKPIDATLVLQPAKSKPISNLLMGIFFEDINYAADGGLYAELIQNRGFEYHPRDKQYRDKSWINTYAWTLNGEGATFIIDSTSPVHPNNPHYAVIEIKQPGASLANSGFDGIAVKKGEQYNFSAFIKQVKGRGIIEIRLMSNNGVLAKARLTNNSSSWKNNKVSLIAAADATDARLELQPLYEGVVALDMISLFPQQTFKGRKNGMRADLAETIAAIHPKFVRFPGGCVAHGDGIQNIYKWKNSIGPLEARKPDRNIWNYHQSMGLGYFEYFRFCEDIGAEPVPIIAAGVPCQNSGTGGGGQQGGIPMNEMDAYIQDIIDLVEYANGDAHTVWGKKRIEAGHPPPFNLKYIGIGNEDQITDVFEERFAMIFKAVREKHPEVTVIGTAGPFFEGT
ncbi:MAG TPA: carbohydrate binding domain-containing protein, partial [Chitinophagaceae bacterium]|nr:carbohydrate binding domain-containing protein [Chitinophagaceae bacterium]